MYWLEESYVLIPPLVRVPLVIHFVLLTVRLGLSLGSKLVSFEITFRYSYEYSSLQALLLVGTRIRDSHLCTLCILKYDFMSIRHAQLWLRKTAKKLFGIFTL